MPPPPKPDVAVLSAMVLSVIVSVPRFSIPPPLSLVRLWATVTESSVSVPSLKMPPGPPLTLFPFSMLRSRRVTWALGATVMTPVTPPPLMIRPGAAEPSIVMSFWMTRGLDDVIVMPPSRRQQGKRDGPAVSMSSAMASRSEPGPLSAVLVTR